MTTPQHEIDNAEWENSDNGGVALTFVLRP
jgi:hypothetical protein